MPPPARRTALAFAVLPVLQWAVSFGAARGLRTVFTYDAAWYYVVARNLAQGRGLLDSALWQFFDAPATVAQPAGSYWEFGWPIVLGAFMRVFGHSQRASIFITAALSGLLPLFTAAVAWLATRRAAVAWLAGLLVVGQSFLLATNTVPDVTLCYQLACLGGLAAFHLARDRELTPLGLVAAGAALALPGYVRGEGFVVALAALPLLLVAPARPRGVEARRVLRLLAGMAVVAVPNALRNLLVFGHATPPARSLRNWMTAYNQLYTFSSAPTAAAFWAQGRQRLLDLRTGAMEAHLLHLTVAIPWPLVALAALGVLAHLRSARGRALVLPLFFVLSVVLPCVAAPLLSNRSRFVKNVLPELSILASIGAFALRDLARRLVDRLPVDIVVLGVALWASVFVFRERRTVKTAYDELAQYRVLPPAAITLGRTLPLAPDDVVLTDDPWRVAAELDVAAVMCPMDGPAAVDALVEKYRPRYVLAAAANRPLKRLATAGRFPMHEVATGPEGAWYELDPPVHKADGR